MRQYVLGFCLLFAVLLAAPAQGQTCADHTKVSRVAVWDESGSNSLVRGTVTIAGLCFYYVQPVEPATAPVVLEVETVSATDTITAVTVGPGAREVAIGGLERSGKIYRQVVQLSGGSNSHRLVLRDTGDNDLHEIRLYAPRRPTLTLRLPTTGCGGTGGCLIRNRPNLVRIEGTYLDQIDVGRSVTAGAVTFPIVLSEGNYFLSVTPGADALPGFVSIPLRTAVAAQATGAVVLTTELSVPLAANVMNARPLVELFPSNGEVPLRTVYTGSVLSVRVVETAGTIVRDSQYQIVETPHDTAAVLATLTPYADNPGGGLLSRLRVNASARLPTTPGDLPLLFVMKGGRIVGALNLSVLPRPRIERVEVARGSTISPTPYLHPEETAIVYLTGSSISAFRDVQADHPLVKVVRSETLPGRLQLTVTTPRAAVPFYDLRLTTVEGVDTVIRFEARAQQRPRPLDFGMIHWTAGNVQGIPLTAVERENEPIRSLEGIRLEFNPAIVDGTAVYGVQYLVLQARLVDHTGAVVDSAVHRIAVRPVGELPYTVEAGYVQTSQVDLDALLSESTLHTKAHSTLNLTLGHDPNRYTGPLPAPITTSFTHRGRLVIEPSFTLPTGMYVVADGFSPQVATMLSGAFLDFSYFPFGKSRTPLPVNLRVGIMAVDPTFLPPGQRRAKLAPTALLNYTIATVRRNLSLSVVAGAMYLNRHTPSDLWEREDFFLLFSPGLTYTIK